MSKAWKGGSTTAWRKLRAVVLANNRAQNRGLCRLQIPGKCTGKATQVHHTKGKAVTGDDPRFLEAVCRECNLHVGDPQKNIPAEKPKKISNW